MKDVCLVEELGGSLQQWVAMEIDGELMLTASRSGKTGDRSFVVDENLELHEIEEYGKTKRMSTIDFRQTYTQVKVNGKWTVVTKCNILVTLAPLDADYIKPKTIIKGGHVKFTKYDENHKRRATIKKNFEHEYK